ncbi:conserved Plasmodium protein, unknown function [Plasmodium chabaudi chabaudi]|uniref:Uncharacterized protein n=1 Tax=Plasmodium chabaudi chabaudi TaxID=31271 RepID=A0A1C6YRM5_PLACU|nr:conserved Plasmodium protein, unknown function [Plasmodium chabaudi chabaudi]SCN62841.1 conserved Plasmodium protein, unknown function [Plasmodium chabaudi chabaudi]
MEYLILEEKYKNLLNKSNYEKTVLKKETEALQKKIENLESSYIEKESKINEITEEKEKLKDELFEIKKENKDLKEHISKLNERIVDISNVCKTYRRMIKIRNTELQETEILISENISLRKNIEDIEKDKIYLESQLKEKTYIINLIKNKYKKNISRLLENYNEKDKNIYEFQNFIIQELNNLKIDINEENENQYCDQSVMNNKIMNICFYIDTLAKKLEEKMNISLTDREII